MNRIEQFEGILPENTGSNDGFLQACATAIAERQESLRGQLVATVHQALEGEASPHEVHYCACRVLPIQVAQQHTHVIV